MCQDQIKNGKYHQTKTAEEIKCNTPQQSMDKYQEFLHQVQLPNLT
jgi:hypothetical protein